MPRFRRGSAWRSRSGCRRDAASTRRWRNCARIAAKNTVAKNYLGQGYSDCITPPVIQRNILENPGWYTAYTPYQAEISQGRLEALLNFQTMVTDLTGLDIANASLLDEATAAAEAMHIAHAVCKDAEANAIFVSERCHPQTIAVVADARRAARDQGDRRRSRRRSISRRKSSPCVLQYPDTTGAIHDYAPFIEQAHAAGALAIVAADILALTLLNPPGEFGADIAVGCTQRFGVPLGFGGPHAAFMAVKDAFKRQMPGRLVGVSQDVARQTRLPPLTPDARAAHPPRQGHEQHLHRAGAPRGDGLDVCGLSRAGGSAERSRARMHLLARTFAGRAGGDGHSKSSGAVLRHGRACSVRGGGDSRASSASAPPDQSARARRNDGRHRAR